jgi:hypothetical protein
MQGQRDGLQLLVASQSTPIKRFAGVAIERIPDGNPELGGNGLKLRISGLLIN